MERLNIAMNANNIHSRGQKGIRFYDPGGNLIEVETPV